MIALKIDRPRLEFVAGHHAAGAAEHGLVVYDGLAINTIYIVTLLERSSMKR